MRYAPSDKQNKTKNLNIWTRGRPTLRNQRWESLLRNQRWESNFRSRMTATLTATLTGSAHFDVVSYVNADLSSSKPFDRNFDGNVDRGVMRVHILTGQ